jgi:hypothetical protein
MTLLKTPLPHSPQAHQPPRLQPVRRIRCTRPDWGNRIGWAVIVASTLYLAVRIVPAFITYS